MNTGTFQNLRKIFINISVDFKDIQKFLMEKLGKSWRNLTKIPRCCTKIMKKIFWKIYEITFLQGVERLPDHVTELLKLATETPPVAKVAIAYTLFIVGSIMLVVSVFCLVRSSSRQETMSLEGTAHYTANDEANKKKKAASAVMNGHTNGKTIDSKVNPAFIGDNAS